MTHIVDDVQEVLDYEMDPGFDALILTDLIILVSEKVTKIHISTPKPPTMSQGRTGWFFLSFSV